MIPWFHYETFTLFGVTFYTFGTVMALSIIAGIYLIDHRAKATGLNPKVAEHLVYWSACLGSSSATSSASSPTRPGRSSKTRWCCSGSGRG